MSCSVKISGKGWCGSQRRISCLPEETTGAQISTPGGAIKIGQPTRVGKASGVKKGEDTAKLMKYIDDNVIGKNGTFFGPFGRRKVVYCDYTSSGRSLQFLEEYISREVLPCLGDTRASTSICSLQSSLFRHEARDIVRHAVGAGEQDAVLFTGHGTDDALRTLLHHLDLPGRPMIVFVGPFEHHANLRPWREHHTKVVRIAETKEGFLDLNDLEKKLQEARTLDGIMVGCFNAASCITGVLADDVATTLMLRQYGALSVWDYTSAGPFVEMDMNPHLPGVGETAVHKDAIIFSGHKFMGGAQSPGVLVIKRSHLSKDIATEDMRDLHHYLRDPELREESGTAGVVESIRCGLAMQLKENVTAQAIVTRQDKISRQVLAHVRTIPELILLGSSSNNIKRLPIFSFMVRHPRGTFLHHNFVCAILNDVFGIQARGGCACAGRYAHDLMGIDTDLARKYESVLSDSVLHCGRDDCNGEALRPGFARLSLPYFMSEAELAFVLEALKMVATEGWKLLPQYVLNPDTGEWRHHTNSVFKERKWLGSIRYTDGKMVASERRVSSGGGVFPQSYSDCLQTARNIFNRARKMAHRYPLQIDRSVNFSEKLERLRWFILPAEAQDLLLGNSQNVKQDLPFDPQSRRHHWREISLSASSIRRLNSDIPRTGNNPLSALSSPRHHSLPALSMTRQSSLQDEGTIEIVDKPKKPFERSQTSGQFSNTSSRSGSPSPAVKFAVGEAVSPPMILGTTPVGARLMSEEHAVPPGGNVPRMGRARCNSLGSSAIGKTLPVPIPLSPQTLASLGLGNSSGFNRSHRPCSCTSRVELSSSLEFDGANDSPNRSPLSSSTSSPTSSSSPSPYPCGYSSLTSHHPAHAHHCPQHEGSTQKLDRCSPILSSFSQSCDDDLHAYLKGRTEDIATEIKSEIREVISKVDDVLSESNLSDLGTPQHYPHRTISAGSDRSHRDDSFSASEIAEYLMEFSKEMASEVKSEIRCMVNAVDGLGRFSPDLHSSTPSTNSPGYKTPERRLPDSPLARLSKGAKLNELLQSQESKMSSECSSDETVIYVVGPRAAAQTNHERAKTSDEEEEHSGKQSAKSVVEMSSKGVKTLPEIYSAINSVSSQDSGINLSFHESDVRTTDHLGRSGSSSSGSSAESSGTSFLKKCKGMVERKRDDKLPNDVSDDEDIREEDVLMSEDEDVLLKKLEQSCEGSGPQWHSPSRSIWKPTVEAIHEYDMIRDKDRILVCLPVSTVGVGVAAGRHSLALLHTLHQYQFYAKSKSIDFEIGAVTINSGSSYDPLESMSYLKNLQVSYFYEEAEEQAELIDAGKNSERNCESCEVCGRAEDVTRQRLYAVAKRYGYNVLALGQHLDDLAEGFLSSLFCTGKLKTMKAHYFVKEQELRVIRPFVYVRERALRQFNEDKKTTDVEGQVRGM
uniref:TtcA_2 protein n=2 Tax=Fopius arisanus TaxID=64838 RepID=A0A0C9RI32_9HYME